LKKSCGDSRPRLSGRAELAMFFVCSEEIPELVHFLFYLS